MNRPLRKLSRRGFLGTMLAAPVAAKTGAVKALMAKVEETAALTAAGTRIAAAVPEVRGVYGLLTNGKLMALYKTGLLPEWAKADVERDALYGMGSVIDPSIAVLRSVSLGNKLRMSLDMARGRLWGVIDRLHTLEMARTAFFGRGRYDPPPGMPAE
jgi:hypothetical protein